MERSKLNAEGFAPHPGKIEVAKRTPNGWVYGIAGKFRDDERIPPEAIVGAWKVDAAGQITGTQFQHLHFGPAIVQFFRTETQFRANCRQSLPMPAIPLLTFLMNAVQNSIIASFAVIEGFFAEASCTSQMHFRPLSADDELLSSGWIVA